MQIENRAPEQLGAIWSYSVGKTSREDSSYILVCEDKYDKTLSWAFIARDEYGIHVDGVNVASKNWYYKDRILRSVRLPKWIDTAVNQHGNLVIINDIEIKTDTRNGKPYYYAVVRGREVKPSEFKKKTTIKENMVETRCDSDYAHFVTRYDLVTTCDNYEEKNISYSRNIKKEKINIKEYGLLKSDCEEFDKSHPWVSYNIRVPYYYGTDVEYEFAGPVAIRKEYERLGSHNISYGMERKMEDTGSELKLNYVPWEHKTTSDESRSWGSEEKLQVAVNSCKLVDVYGTCSTHEYESDDGWGTRSVDCYGNNAVFEFTFSDGGKTRKGISYVSKEILQRFGGSLNKEESDIYNRLLERLGDESELKIKTNNHEYVIEKHHGCIGITDQDGVISCLNVDTSFVEIDEFGEFKTRNRYYLDWWGNETSKAYIVKYIQ